MDNSDVHELRRATIRALPPVDEMRRAYLASDASYNGIFYLGVRTTGIFCKPSCTARKPLPKNVEFFATVNDAVFAGYRPCKRCRPLEANGAPPEWVQKLIKDVEQNPHERIREWNLRQMGIDPARARRYFQQHYGMTFNAYQRGRRMTRALADIRNGTKVDNAAFDHGYASTSGFREAFGKLFGQAPREAATSDCIVLSWHESPVGPLILGATTKGLCLLEFPDRRMLETQLKVLRARVKCPLVPGDNEHLAAIKDELTRYFEGRLKEFTVPLIYPGTEFQQNVWRNLLKIPYGETCSYEDLARAVGSPKAVRAVGTANGCNRIAIVIPCHRVVNKGGKLGGYGGGLWRKQILLDLERGQRRFE
jgi:AraC family transcriptional regulator, regulatory protein of adaptative response / methylated-DNA-[protein]-cysteine methyltransferase